MKKPIIYSLLVLCVLFSGCNSKSEVEIKKEELKEKKKELKEIQSAVLDIEKELDELDASWRGLVTNTVLVKTKTLIPQKFEHKIEARGSIKSRKHIDVLAETMGRVKQVNVTEGKKVKKGQLLLSIDSEQLHYTLKEVNSSLDLANKVYEKRSALWKQNIGSEIDYLKAKNDFESLEAKQRQIKAQLKFASVTAPFSGTIDQVYINKGQVVQPGVPVVRLVDNKEMYLEANIADGYVGKFHANDDVHVIFPAINESVDTKVAAVGKVIDPVNRTFVLEAKIPSSTENVQPNLLATIQLTDLAVEEAIVVPTRVIQKDNKGVYVYVISQKGKQKTAVKRHVTASSDFKGMTYVSQGLKANDQVIVEGYRQVTPNTIVEITK